MDPVIPHLYSWAKVAVRSKNFPTLLFCVDPDFCHLLVKLDYHRSEPPRRWIPAVSCHLIHGIHSFYDPMQLELISYYLVVALD